MDRKNDFDDDADCSHLKKSEQINWISPVDIESIHDDLILEFNDESEAPVLIQREAERLNSLFNRLKSLGKTNIVNELSETDSAAWNTLHGLEREVIRLQKACQETTGSERESNLRQMKDAASELDKHRKSECFKDAVLSAISYMEADIKAKGDQSQFRAATVDNLRPFLEATPELPDSNGLEFSSEGSEFAITRSQIDWAFWIRTMPELSSAQAARLLSGLDPVMYKSLDPQVGRSDPSHEFGLANKIEILALAQGILSMSPRKWISWAEGNGFPVHGMYRIAVDTFHPERHEAEESEPIECETKESASASASASVSEATFMTHEESIKYEQVETHENKSYELRLPGQPTQEIIENLNLEPKKWKDKLARLNNKAQAYRMAVEARGGRGKTGTLWNPAKFCICLLLEKERKNVQALRVTLFKKYPDWVPEFDCLVEEKGLN